MTQPAGPAHECIVVLFRPAVPAHKYITCIMYLAPKDKCDCAGVWVEGGWAGDHGSVLIPCSGELHCDWWKCGWWYCFFVIYLFLLWVDG